MAIVIYINTSFDSLAVRWAKWMTKYEAKLSLSKKKMMLCCFITLMILAFWFPLFMIKHTTIPKGRKSDLLQIQLNDNLQKIENKKNLFESSKNDSLISLQGKPYKSIN